MIRCAAMIGMDSDEPKMTLKKGKVVVAMSGGVDSSVAAALLLQQGYDVVGAFMRLGSPAGSEPAHAEQCEVAEPATQNKQGCCSVLDADDARRVAQTLDIPFYVLNFQEDFARVIDYFVSEYNRGRTPNPCIRCNDWLKFGKLAAYARAVGADFIASGHYARIGTDPATAQPALMRGIDARKDQSYVLFGMSRQTLAHTLLPIGAMAKTEVRHIAQELGLPVFNKPDSQEICFVPNQDYAALVKRRAPEAFSQGEFVASDGRAIGTHAGHQNFTIGQRRGVGVAAGVPLYVIDIDASQNRVMLGEKSATLRQSFIAGSINVLHDGLASSARTIRCSAKIRYNQSPQPAMARWDGADHLAVEFDEPQSAITPGQAMVLYDDDIVLGGGWIESVR